jgi:hypothetical protein
VHEIRFGVFTGGLELVEPLRRGVANGDQLQRQDVEVTRVHGAEVVGEAEAIAPFLPGDVNRASSRRAPPSLSTAAGSYTITAFPSDWTGK